MRFVLTLILLAFVTVPAEAQQKSQLAQQETLLAQQENMPAQLQAVISGQLAAFARGDGRKAYTYAAPVIQEIFPTSDRFMQMVVQGYSPLINPRSVTFQEPEFGDGRAVQAISLLGADGRAWVAVYFMQQTADGSWKIAGVQLLPAPEGAV